MSNRFCAVGDHVLQESKKEQVEKPPEQTQQDFVVKSFEEAAYSKTVDVVQIFRTRPVCDAHGRSTAPYCR